MVQNPSRRQMYWLAVLGTVLVGLMLYAAHLLSTELGLGFGQALQLVVVGFVMLVLALALEDQ